MSKRSLKMPSHRAILEAHGSQFEADSCWGCGFVSEKKNWQERAHIVAVCNGGSNEPSNFWLLCSACHRNQPDGAPAEAQWAWLRNRPSWQEEGMRQVREIIAYMQQKVGQAGVEEIERSWSVNEIRACFMSKQSAAAHAGNRLATARWAMAAEMIASVGGNNG